MKGNPSLEPEEFKGFDTPQTVETEAPKRCECNLQTLLFGEILFLLANTAGTILFWVHSPKDSLRVPVVIMILWVILLAVTVFLFCRIRKRDNYNYESEDFNEDDLDQLSWGEYYTLREYGFVRILAPSVLAAVSATELLSQSSISEWKRDAPVTSAAVFVPFWVMYVAVTQYTWTRIVHDKEGALFVGEVAK